MDRFDAAGAAGFAAVEMLFPYELPAREVQQALGRNGLRMVLINAPPPNYTGGERGFAAVPGSEARFDHDMRRAFRYAQALGVGVIHVMAGEGAGEEARAAMIDNLTRACAAAPKGITLTIEPLCAESAPGYFLNDYNAAAEIIAAVGAPDLGLQFDSYHAQMIHGDAVAIYEKFADIIRHVQLGDAPGRVPPGQGSVDFAGLFAALRAAKYRGYVAGEYTPGGATEKTLDWVKAL
ncbi:TIM barrel protein [Sulfitobacter albidus]|uniref:TIM barrel protein n=1 Tax=Sulfitobacter albidus TaxID=2829501 RepID=A0A975PP22_9RHOB|nr:TIM barrel protein [Sulfitobacter albidus]